MGDDKHNGGEKSSVTVEAGEAGQRLDKLLAAKCADLSRSRIQQLIAQGHVRKNGAAARDASAKVKAGECYAIFIPDVEQSRIAAQNIPLEIVYEDADMLILNKPPGMTVHPAPGNPDKTLVNALLAHCGDSLSGIGGVARPGIVHRIDKDTSGLLAVAKHDAAHRALAAQLADHTLGRTYLALVWGKPKTPRGTLRSQIGRSPVNRKKMAVLKSGGKHAVTHYKTLEHFDDGKGKTFATLVECELETGRTHQIRVHLSHGGNPLVGDAVYGGATAPKLRSLILPAPAREALAGFTRQALHAAQLRLVHPASGQAMRFDSPLPGDMAALLKALTLPHDR